MRQRAAPFEDEGAAVSKPPLQGLDTRPPPSGATRPAALLDQRRYSTSDATRPAALLDQRRRSGAEPPHERVQFLAGVHVATQA